MGKYIPKKPKSVKEVSTFSSGVRTRAKTLALQRLNANSLCYLQLRNRRLEKPSFVNRAQRPRQQQKQTHDEEKGQFGKIGEIEGSVGGDNNFEFQDRERSTSGSIDGIGTLGSSTRNTSSFVDHQQVQNDGCTPTALELEEFFFNAEQENRRLFIEKYNFDIANDLPLPGRYEWAKLSP